ncbi:hypothetical protein TRFO_11470 [Tritrichomonas foetus]|uniref:DUF3447 domain-containing protein n=1 Tax=Tritrichomonas foetus TaxID=1144522 RepID=A0A1J4J3F3_9EUKA|nr:hypothetical protein TRFO_11470 [Tritrichomonas foetus]|eukprot:OHS93984.1 hypothetical protein TRFO_11470 [Tritrichomonas foetus]
MNSFELHGLPQKSTNYTAMLRNYYVCFSFKEIVESLKALPTNFIIKTKTAQFPCHLEVAAAVSSLVYQAIEKNPSLREFSFDGDDSKFDQIGRFLNGETVQIDDDNKSYIETVANDLKFTFRYSSELSIKKLSGSFVNSIQGVPKTLTIKNQTSSYSINRLIGMVFCQNIFNSEEDTFSIDEKENISEIADFLNGQCMSVSFDNHSILRKCCEILNIRSLKPTFDVISAYYSMNSQAITQINLQNIINEVNPSNIDSIFNEIVQSDYVKEEKGLFNDLLNAFETSFKVRPRFFESVIELFVKIHASLNSSNFHNSLINYISQRWKAAVICLPFVRQLFYRGILSDENIQQFMKIKVFNAEYCEYTFNMIKNLFLNNIITYFARHSFDIDQQAMKKAISGKNCYNFGMPSMNLLAEYKGEDDNFKSFEECVILGHRPDNIVTAIFKDDADTLHQIISMQPDFNLNKKLPAYILDYYDDIKNEVSLVELACFYGSVNCFKFLLLQPEVDISTCQRFAIAGGNTEIIRNLERKNITFHDTFTNSIKFHHYDIFRWLVMNYGPIKHRYSRMHGAQMEEPVVPAAIKYNNLSAFLYLAEYGIEEPNLSQYISLISHTFESLNLFILKYLSQLPSVEIYATHSKVDATILYHATSIDWIEGIKVLLESGRVDRSKFKTQVAHPLLAAVKLGRIEAFKLLASYFKGNIPDMVLEKINDQEYLDILKNA